MPGHIQTGESIHWCTPQNVVNSVRDFFDGAVDLDPCSNDQSIVAARVEFKLPVNDGLEDRWDVVGAGTSVYVNPPFGRVYLRDDRRVIFSAKEWSTGRKAWAAWVKAGRLGTEPAGVISDRYAARFRSTSVSDWVRAANTAAGQGCEIVMLLPGATDTAQWQDGIFVHATAVVFIRGRLTFRGSVKGPAPMCTALVYWGDHASRFERIAGRLGTYSPVSPSAVTEYHTNLLVADAIPPAEHPV